MTKGKAGVLGKYPGVAFVFFCIVLCVFLRFFFFTFHFLKLMASVPNKEMWIFCYRFTMTEGVCSGVREICRRDVFHEGPF